jgi:hypothetical protein
MKNEKVLKEIASASYNGAKYVVKNETTLGTISQLTQNTSIVSIRDLFKVRIRK